MFNKNKTKWIPLGYFNWDGTDYIVFVRGNKKTGMMYFKVKNVNGRIFSLNHSISNFNFIKVEKQWEELLKMMNN